MTIHGNISVYLGCNRDEDGFYWITGRIDDLMNVSGHLLSTAEIESALVEHPSIAEAAVVGYPHPVKGNGIYCFVTPMNVSGSGTTSCCIISYINFFTFSVVQSLFVCELSVDLNLGWVQNGMSPEFPKLRLLGRVEGIWFVLIFTFMLDR